MNNIAVHKLPTSCYVCGEPVPNHEGATRPNCSHNFTNAEAEDEATKHDSKMFARSKEAAYVDEYRHY